MKNNFYRKLLNLELFELGLVTRTNLFTNADKIYDAISKNQAKIVMISYLSQILATSAKVLGTELCFKLFLRFFQYFLISLSRQIWQLMWQLVNNVIVPFLPDMKYRFNCVELNLY